MIETEKKWGAWIANILLTLGIVLFLAGVIAFFTFKALQNDSVLFTFLILGTVFITFALGFDRLLPRSKRLMRNFCIQSALLLMITGKIFIIFAIATKFPDPWIMTMMLGISSLSTYFIFQNIIDRFLFLLFFLFSLTFNLIFSFESNVSLFILFVLTILAILALHIFKRRALLYIPIKAALICYACLLTILVSLNILYLSNMVIVPEIAFNLVLVGMIIIFILDHAGSVNHLRKLPILFSCVGLLILSMIVNTGILWGITLLILGYQNNKRILIGLGAFFLITFLIFYYYNLASTLDYKSYLLIGSGLFLLLTCVIIQRLKWDRLSSEHSEKHE